MPGKNYLTLFRERSASDLTHKVTTDWDESKVKRDAGGKFSTIRQVIRKFKKQHAKMRAQQDQELEKKFGLVVPETGLTMEMVRNHYDGPSPERRELFKTVTDQVGETSRLALRYGNAIERARELKHWGVSNPFKESEVFRDASGQFASAADAVSDTADDLMDVADEKIDEATNFLMGGGDILSTLSELIDNAIEVRTVDPSTSPFSGMRDGYDWDNSDDISYNDVPYENRYTGPFLNHDDLMSMVKAISEDLQQHGVLGMKWGRRRTDAQIAQDTKARASKGEEVTPTEKAKAVTSGTESAAQRYARLSGEAKGDGAKNWDEADLKFFNARTEALSKVNKMFQEDPSWLNSTSRRVLQNAAQRTMQDIANGVTNKYITSKLLDAINDNSAAVKAESNTAIDYVGRHRAKKKN